jgi:hypothetical protein
MPVATARTTANRETMENRKMDIAQENKQNMRLHGQNMTARKSTVNARRDTKWTTQNKYINTGQD